VGAAKAGAFRKRSFCNDGHPTPLSRARARTGKNESPRQTTIITTPLPATTFLYQHIHPGTLSSTPLDSFLSITDHTHSTVPPNPIASLPLPADADLTASIVIKSYQSAPTYTIRLPLHDTTRNTRPDGLPLLFLSVDPLRPTLCRH
jgi:hypothetical protein